MTPGPAERRRLKAKPIAGRRPARLLPAQPPTLIVPPPVWPWNPDFMAGSLSNVLPTMHVFLRGAFGSSGRQTMICVGGRFHAWCDAELTWRALELDELHASLYRFLREKRWPAVPKHIRRLVAILRLELHYPRPAAIWSAT